MREYLNDWYRFLNLAHDQGWGVHLWTPEDYTYAFHQWHGVLALLRHNGL